MNDEAQPILSKPSEEASHETQKKSNANSLLGLSMAALGVVFGDIGTSPLYAIRECFYGDYGVGVTQENVLGVLSLIFWTLLLIVSFKYLIFIMRADNDGEGGIIALTALIKSRKTHAGHARWFLLGMGLFGAALLYGDGMITPAISVMSAVEGLNIITPFFRPWVVPLTIIILAGLFIIQRKGTARIGSLFGPVILLWLVSLAVLGLIQVIQYPFNI